jgi:hypothetical protein
VGGLEARGGMGILRCECGELKSSMMMQRPRSAKLALFDIVVPRRSNYLSHFGMPEPCRQTLREDSSLLFEQSTRVIAAIIGGM